MFWNVTLPGSGKSGSVGFEFAASVMSLISFAFTVKIKVLVVSLDMFPGTLIVKPPRGGIEIPSSVILTKDEVIKGIPSCSRGETFSGTLISERVEPKISFSPSTF